MRKSIILLTYILIFSSLFYISCKKEKESHQGDIEVVINENIPQDSSPSLRFEENLSITRKGWWPTDVAVDDEGNIYAFGEKELFIYKFDSRGKEILKKVFPKGKGPGDFFFLDPYFSCDGRLFIFDKLNQRLSILNQNCEILDTKKIIKGNNFNLRLDSKGNMFFWVGKTLIDDETKKKSIIIALVKFSSIGEPLGEIFKFPHTPHDFDKDKNAFIQKLYAPSGIYKLDSNDYVYCARSDKYEINVISPQGELVKQIIKKGQSRKSTKKDIEKLIYKEVNAPYGVEFISPKYMPYIANLFILDNKYLLVITYENDFDEETLAGDLFDERGIFQNRVEVPKYYNWYYLFAALKSNVIYKNKNFYTIETDENEENFYVKRYKMILSNS
jgi:hypothetical protein